MFLLHPGAEDRAWGGGAGSSGGIYVLHLSPAWLGALLKESAAESGGEGSSTAGRWAVRAGAALLFALTRSMFLRVMGKNRKLHSFGFGVLPLPVSTVIVGEPSFLEPGGHFSTACVPLLSPACPCSFPITAGRSGKAPAPLASVHCGWHPPLHGHCHIWQSIFSHFPLVVSASKALALGTAHPRAACAGGLGAILLAWKPASPASANSRQRLLSFPPVAVRQHFSADKATVSEMTRLRRNGGPGGRR